MSSSTREPGPKCAPSRFSILTGRQPTRCLYAIEKTLEEGSGIFGPDLSSNKVKMTWEDGIFNIPTVLRDNGYHTGMRTLAEHIWLSTHI